MAALLDIFGLNVEFSTPHGRVHALRNVNVSIPQNKILGVVGESGSGKSTLVWTILHLLASNGSVTGGRIEFGGSDVLRYGAGQLRRFRGEKVSMVFQDPITSQIPVLDYRTQMTDILYRRKDMSRSDKIEAAVRLMRRVGIPDAHQRVCQFPHQFSGGMRQRAGIAMALLMDPMLLIADEPTTALDVTMEAQIIHLLRETQTEFNSTIMLVSHNLGLIAELCDEVVVMYAGEIVEHASVNDIFFNPAHPYTRALLECNPAIDLKLERSFPTIPGDVPDLHRLPEGCVFAPRCPHRQHVCRTRTPEPSSICPATEGIEHSVRCHMHDLKARNQFQPPEPTRPESAPDTSKRKIEIESTPDPVPLLTVDALHVRFPVMGKIRAALSRAENRFVAAVLNSSLYVESGETLGLVGESGSGKTTLGLSIVGLNKVESGAIRFRGENLVGLSQRQYKSKRRNISMMFQDPIGSLSPRKTVQQLLTEPFKIHGIEVDSMPEKARQLCEMVSLPANFLSRYPHELSGGQARRVGVARSLALNPALIIADEPTAGLDVSVQGEILNLMVEMQKNHRLGYLIISHNLPVIRQIADRLAIMYLGRIVEQGECEQIFSNPAHPYSKALVNGTPSPDPTRKRELVSIEGEVPSLTNRPSGCEFHPRCQFSDERCRQIEPQNTLLSDGRIVRCHYPLAS